MEKEKKLTVKDLKTLHLLCGSWTRRNESIDNRKKSVDEVRTLQHKLFWLYNEYPFKDGDDYWTIENGDVVYSCWDETSEELHTHGSIYYNTKQEAINILNQD
tara:strand:- start:7435 stop:7743 length:309 start_codon:yes stop_codon:yes gene_type:complete